MEPYAVITFILLGGWAIALLLAGALLTLLFTRRGRGEERAKNSPQCPSVPSLPQKPVQTRPSKGKALRSKIKKKKPTKTLGHRGNPHTLAQLSNIMLARYSLWYTTHRDLIRTFVLGKEDANNVFGLDTLTSYVYTHSGGSRHIPKNNGGIDVLIHFYEKDWGRGSFPKRLLAIKRTGESTYTEIAQELDSGGIYTLTVSQLTKQLQRKGIEVSPMQVQRQCAQWFFRNIYLTGNHLPVDTHTSPHA